jgi:hypothetical protein
VTSADRLLLLCLRGGATVEAIARGAEGDDVSWSLLLDRARAHGVTPLVARALETAGWPGVPAACRQALERARRVNAARNLLAASALARVCAVLSGAGVPVIPLKGVALGESLYGDPGVRVSSDIDILVPRARMACAWALITGLGYARAEQEPAVAPGDLDLLLESNHEYAFVSPDGAGGALELHWAIAWRWPRGDDALADLWAEARPRPFRGVPAWTLGPAWELLYLAVHAARHRWQALKWLVDVHEICRRGVDWKDIRTRAECFGLEDVLGLTLAASATVLDTPIPPDVRLRPLPSWLDLFPTAPRPLDVWRGALYPAGLFARPKDKVGYLARVLFLPTLADRRACRLPARLEALHYPFRPVRLAWRWARTLTFPRDRADDRGSTRPGPEPAGAGPSNQESA